MKKINVGYVYDIYAQIVSAKENACIDAIYKWAKENDIDEVMLFDECKLKEILRLGCIEYQKIYGD